jgi:hypothetical protein
MQEKLRKLLHLGSRSDRRRNSSRRNRRSDLALCSFRSSVAVGVLLRAVARDVASLAALVASLARRVEGSAVRSGAVARDVAQLAAGVALHGLGLAVARKVVRTTALVAGGRTTAAVTSTSESAGISSASSWGATSGTGTASSDVSGVGAGTLMNDCQ